METLTIYASTDRARFYNEILPTLPARAQVWQVRNGIGGPFGLGYMVGSQAGAQQIAYLCNDQADLLGTVGDLLARNPYA